MNTNNHDFKLLATLAEYSALKLAADADTSLYELRNDGLTDQVIDFLAGIGLDPEAFDSDVLAVLSTAIEVGVLLERADQRAAANVAASEAAMTPPDFPARTRWVSLQNPATGDFTDKVCVSSLDDGWYVTNFGTGTHPLFIGPFTDVGLAVDSITDALMQDEAIIYVGNKSAPRG